MSRADIVRAHVVVAWAIVFFVCAVPATSDVVEIGADRDNTLYQKSDGSLSNGAGEFFFAGATDQGEDDRLRRGLIRFDVAAAIPAGATINSATLTLYMSRTENNTARDVGLHPALQDWGEGVSDAGGNEGTGTSAENNDATWLYTFYNESDPPISPAWTSSGGDYFSTASATLSVEGNGFYNWGSTTAMVADVQSWVDAPATNYGWLLLGDESEVKTAKRFNSHQFTGNSSRLPKLTVDFTPAVPSGACCLPDGSCITVTAEVDCANQGGVFEGFGTDCGTTNCPQPTGACCFNDGTCQVLTEPDCTGAGGTYQGDNTSCTPSPCGLVLTPFVDPLPLPGIAQPVTGTPGGVATYEMAIREVQQQFHTDLPLTTVWGYGDGAVGATYPGPTILANMGDPITVTWLNDLRYVNGPSQGQLRSEHFMPVDTCLHGPNHAGATARTVVHLHGGHVPARFDGYPEHTQLPGESVTYTYDNNQLPATLWYHDHALGITRLNVMMGLAGFYLLSDADELALNLPSGQFEIGLAVQDRTFDAAGNIIYPAVWQDHFFGEFPVVNGKVSPFLQVKRGKYRFRLLNGSNSRRYVFGLSDGADFHLIGTDGGLLDAPVTVSQLDMGPGERVDVVIDFESYSNGTEIILTNADIPSFAGAPVIPEIMKFVVQGGGGHTAPLPTTLRTNEVLLEADSIQTRDFILRKSPASSPTCGNTWWLINGLTWEDITEYPELTTTEVWRFINPTGQLHPMHMHLVMFQVLDHTPITLGSDNEPIPTGPAVPPLATEEAWKDTVQVQPHTMTRVIARFEDYAGKYAYHCHILEHEDHEMMRQFQSVPPCSADLNGDGTVNVADLLALLTDWGGCPVPCSTLGEINVPDTCPADVNRDCTVDVGDLLDMLRAWGSCD